LSANFNSSGLIPRTAALALKALPEVADAAGVYADRQRVSKARREISDGEV
jgi:hypothetical protein